MPDLYSNQEKEVGMSVCLSRCTAKVFVCLFVFSQILHDSICFAVLKFIYLRKFCMISYWCHGTICSYLSSIFCSQSHLQLPCKSSFNPLHQCTRPAHVTITVSFIKIYRMFLLIWYQLWISILTKNIHTGLPLTLISIRGYYYHPKIFFLTQIAFRSFWKHPPLILIKEKGVYTNLPGYRWSFWFFIYEIWELWLPPHLLNVSQKKWLH